VTSERYAVIGGGIVGLAVARALAMEGRASSVTVIEKEPALGTHQTSRNSGVVHAGLYYLPGSDKARFSRRGVQMLRDYCRERDVRFIECGKVLIARDDDEVERLRRVQGRAEANGVPRLRWLSAREIQEVEPHAVGRAGLHSPTTAIVDFGDIARAYAEDARAAGADIRTGQEVIDIVPGRPNTVVTDTGAEVLADRVVIAAGLHADRLARLAGDTAYPRIVPFRGEYLALTETARSLVRGLIYPVPDPRFPFLGVHLTRRVDGSVLIGPNAVLALAREGYRRGSIDPTEVAELLRFKGFRDFARANVGAGVREVWGSVNRRAFVAAASRYVPELTLKDVEDAPAGIRAQAMSEDGRLVDDFRFSRVGTVFCIRNAPSPAATASLAIAEMVLDRMRA
jgi:L-2-hydroxyglutarate oxidase